MIGCGLDMALETIKKIIVSVRDTEISCNDPNIWNSPANKGSGPVGASCFLKKSILSYKSTS